MLTTWRMTLIWKTNLTCLYLTTLDRHPWNLIFNVKLILFPVLCFHFLSFRFQWERKMTMTNLLLPDDYNSMIMLPNISNETIPKGNNINVNNFPYEVQKITLIKQFQLYDNWSWNIWYSKKHNLKSSW